MNDVSVFDVTIDQIPQKKFREMLRKLRGEDRNQTSAFSVMVTSGAERLTTERLGELKRVLSGYLPEDLLKTTEDVEMAATAIAGRSVKIR